MDRIFFEASKLNLALDYYANSCRDEMKRDISLEDFAELDTVSAIESHMVYEIEKYFITLHSIRRKEKFGQTSKTEEKINQFKSSVKKAVDDLYQDS